MLTHDLLLLAGYTPEDCKIGTLYFKSGFFCRIKSDGTVDVRRNSDDMRSLGIAHSLNEIAKIEKEYFIKLRQSHVAVIKQIDAIIKSYEEKEENEKSVLETSGETEHPVG